MSFHRCYPKRLNAAFLSDGTLAEPQRSRYYAGVKTIYLGLGSNLGNREENLKRALAALAPEITVTKVSKTLETEPMYVTDQPKFLNLVCEATTELSAVELLKKIKAIEKEMGEHEHNQPRVIDIDLLLYGDENINAVELTVPHPKIAERPFVLEPLSEIAPEVAKRFLRPKIVGIVNITSDSFSDGGKFLEPAAAIAHAKELIADGADIIELSGASSNPNSAPVPPDVEIQRIESVLDALDCPISVDAAKPEVQRWALSNKVAYLNDIRGFPDQSLYPELAASDAKLVVMHFIFDLDKAVRVEKSIQEVFDSIYSFFETRLPQLEKAGIARERLIIDPGMGFFLASNPEPSLAVLENIGELKSRFGLPVMIAVSRKSFLRNTERFGNGDIGARTLAAELYASEQGADYIRTHEVRELRRALGA